VPSERCSIEDQSIEYCGWACVSSDVVRKPFSVSPETVGLGREYGTGRCHGEAATSVLAKSSGRRLRTFSRSRRKTS
jgi:hypothetical protein